jgi:hypothetical protein
MLSKVLINPFRSNEGRECYRFHQELEPGDIFLGDRAFCSYAHICALIKLGAHALFRLHQKVTADFTPGRKYAPPREAGSFPGQVRSKQIQLLGKKDQIVQWHKTPKVSWMTREQHNALPELLLSASNLRTISRNKSSLFALFTTSSDSSCSRLQQHRKFLLIGSLSAMLSDGCSAQIRILPSLFCSSCLSDQDAHDQESKNVNKKDFNTDSKPTERKKKNGNTNLRA